MTISDQNLPQKANLLPLAAVELPCFLDTIHPSLIQASLVTQVSEIKDEFYYCYMLQRLNDSGAELWHEEIQQCIDKANNIAEEAEKREPFNLHSLLH